MRSIDWYLLRKQIMPFLFFLMVLTGIVWLARSLQVVELVISNGQNTSVFLELAALLVPFVLSIILPLAALVGVIFAFYRALSDSEIVVLFSAGFSRFSLARSVLFFAAGMVLLLAFISLYLTPASLRQFQSRTQEVGRDIASSLVQEGRFLHPVRGLTVYIRDIRPDGHMLGVFVHDSREAERQTTFHAESAILLQTPEGPVLVLKNGLAERASSGEGDLTLLQFSSFNFDLSAYLGGGGPRTLKPQEMWLSELFSVDKNSVDERRWGQIVAERHDRISGILHGLSLPLIGVAIMLQGFHSRRGYGLRISMALMAGVAVRSSSFVIKSLVVKSPGLWPLFYLVPLLVVLTALGVLILSGSLPKGRGALRMAEA